MTSSLFASWVRWTCDFTCKNPSDVIRLESFSFTINFCSSDKKEDESMGNEPITAVSTLFTFCPPLPPLRVVWNCISEVKSIIVCQFAIGNSQSAIGNSHQHQYPAPVSSTSIQHPASSIQSPSFATFVH